MLKFKTAAATLAARCGGTLASFLAAAFLLAIGSAQSQVRYTPPPSLDSLTVQIMAKFAKCVADLDPSGARRIVEADYLSPAYSPAIRAFALSHRNCLRFGQLRFNPILLAGGMAEELEKKDRLSEAAFVTTASADTRNTAERCVIRRRPREVWGLFQTEPASFAETEAVKALRGDYVSCASTAGPAGYDRILVRARLALAAYRLLNGPVNAPGEER